MPFLCHSSHTLSTGLPWGSSSHNFMALFWVTAAEELSISQNLTGGKRPNKRLGSHPVYFLSHDVMELPFSPSMVTPPHLSQPASLIPLQEGHPKWVALPQNLISKQKHIMDSWLQLTEAEFSTRHTFNPRGLCHWILLDKIHPGESCQSKEQGIRVLTAGIRGCCAPGSHYTCVCSCFQQEGETHRRCWLTLRGFRTSTQPEQSSKSASLSWWQHPMQLLPSPSNKVLWSFSIPPALPWMSEISPECLLLMLLLRKYFNEIYEDE